MNAARKKLFNNYTQSWKRHFESQIIKQLTYQASFSIILGKAKEELMGVGKTNFKSSQIFVTSGMNKSHTLM